MNWGLVRAELQTVLSGECLGSLIVLWDKREVKAEVDLMQTPMYCICLLEATYTACALLNTAP